MPTRVRKMVGGVAILAFLVFYMGLCAWAADHVPEQWALKLGFFFVAGTAWGLPLLPLLSWMNRGGDGLPGQGRQGQGRQGQGRQGQGRQGQGRQGQGRQG